MRRCGGLPGGVRRRRAGAVIAKCSHCIVLSQFPAGGSRHGAGWCDRQLSDFPASRLVGVVVGAGGGCVCGYSEALMRISERGCIRAAE